MNGQYEFIPHVIDFNFGYKVDPNKYINDLIAKLPPCNANDAGHVLREIYDIEYGIYNHQSPDSEKRPLAAIGVHYAESQSALVSVVDYIREFIKKDLHKYGISFEAYMNMPGDVAKAVILEVDAKQREEAAHINNTLGNSTDPSKMKNKK